MILDLCLGKTQSGKSRDYRDTIVFEKLGFQIILWVQELKAGVLNFLWIVGRFRKALFSWWISVNRIGPPQERKGVFKFRRFKEPFQKNCFSDGSEWNEGLTVEIKLRFQITLA